MKACSGDVQEAFLHSLYAATGVEFRLVSDGFQIIRTYEDAQQFLYNALSEDESTRSASASLVHLQSMLLMILEADTRGPENLQGQDGINKKVLLGMAYLRGYELVKSVDRLRPEQPVDQETDSTGNLARRAWIVLGILSRWFAVGTAGPDVFGTNEIGTKEDERLLSSTTLQIASK